MRQKGKNEVCVFSLKKTARKVLKNIDTPKYKKKKRMCIKI